MAKKKKKKEDGRFEEGNKVAEKWTKESMLKIFEACYDFSAKDGEVVETEDSFYIKPADALSIYDVTNFARKEFNLPSRTFYDWAKKDPVLQDIKKDIHHLILARINRGALTTKQNPVASIWRMKQLGERDPDKQDQIDALKGLAFKVTQD